MWSFFGRYIHTWYPLSLRLYTFDIVKLHQNQGQATRFAVHPGVVFTLKWEERWRNIWSQQCQTCNSVPIKIDIILNDVILLFGEQAKWVDSSSQFIYNLYTSKWLSSKNSTATCPKSSLPIQINSDQFFQSSEGAEICDQKNSSGLHITCGGHSQTDSSFRSSHQTLPLVLLADKPIKTTQKPTH